MLNKLERMDNSKKIPIAIGISIGIIIFMVVFYLLVYNRSKYADIKVDNTKGLVYTVDSSNNLLYRIEVPYVNINSSFGKSINEEINSYVADYTNKGNVKLTYKYSINGDVLSIIIKTTDYGVETIPLIYFKSYNINLNDQVLLGDEDLLAIYGISSEEVESIIEKKFEYWYGKVKEKGYVVEQECDYECFLKYRDVDDYMDNVVYYIDKGKLVAFKPFVFYSIFGEEEFFKEKDYEFILSK